MVRDAKYPISGHTELDDAADHMAGYTYRYKSPTDEPRSQPNGDRYAGVIAQRMAEHPLTRQTVQPTEHGLTLESKPLLSLLSAQAGRTHDRLNSHERAIMHMHGALVAMHHKLTAMHHGVGHGESEKQRIANIVHAKFRKPSI